MTTADPPESGMVHGPWWLTWTEHDVHHQAADYYHPRYVLNPTGWPDVWWCNECQTGVITTRDPQ